MGRASTDKPRIRDPKKRERWAGELLPHFMDEGIRALSMDRIAALIGKSKATVYKHYESHEEIVTLIIQRKLTELRHFQAFLNDDSQSYRERYMQTVAYVSKHLGNVSTIFLSDLKTIYPHLWELLDQFKQMALTELRSFYVDGIRDGEFDDISPDLMVLSDELFFDALTNPDYLAAKGLNLQHAFDSYFRMRFYGILKR